jgi:hypothetical protein
MRNAFADAQDRLRTVGKEGYMRLAAEVDTYKVRERGGGGEDEDEDEDADDDDDDDDKDDEEEELVVRGGRGRGDDGGGGDSGRRVARACADCSGCCCLVSVVAGRA